MNKNLVFVLATAFLGALSQSAYPQGEAALPFLLINPAPDASGRGNIATAVPSLSPIATAVNPGQLGLFSLDQYFGASSYLGKTNWLPAYNQPDLTYNAFAFSGGYNFSELVSFPVSFSVGLGYSQIDLNLGEFIRTGSGGPDEIARFEAYERAKNFSLALGLEYIVRLGFGWNFKSAHSKLGPAGTEQGQGAAEATVSMRDFGLLLQAPLVGLIGAAADDTLMLFNSVKPVIDVNFGYSLANLGDESVRYIDAGQADPLPRNAIAGLSLQLGLTKETRSGDWSIFSFTIAREAEDLLVERDTTGMFSYKPGWGDISFFRNVVGGKTNDCVNIRRGWELAFAEAVYLRGGSYSEEPGCGNRKYSTSGYAVRLLGMLRLLEVIAPQATETGFMRFLVEHLDLVFDHASYEGQTTLSGTTYDALTVIIR